ncbi:hypothetical protein B0H13DRAFT_1864411 [Mycena leptocephala]|nr:hypothetical protein B0H13DRAFT_1864411 [Mycena leptocephala]
MVKFWPGSPRHAKDATSLPPSLPLDASLVNPPHSPKKGRCTNQNVPAHRPSPQLRVKAVIGKGRSSNSFDVLVDVDDMVSKSKEKEMAFAQLKERSTAAASFDELVGAFKALVTLMRDYRTSAPTVACFDALDAIHHRLENHHEIPRGTETSDSFGALLTKVVVTPMASISAQLQTHHKAIQALSKVVESGKTSQATGHPCPSAPSTLQSPPKAKPPPLLHPSDERILVRYEART